MNNQEDAWEKLEAEFDHYLVDMKPYVLKLPQKIERQRCALWIKKLCDPLGTGAGITGRKNRNLYAKLLLHMLKRGVLEGPFTVRPEAGVLKTLPTYMSIYFDEPNSSRSQNTAQGELPDWVLGELETRELKLDESWNMPPKDNSAFATSPPRHQYKYNKKLNSRSLSPKQEHNEESLTIHHTGDHPKKAQTSFDDSDIEARLNSWNLGIENPRYLREKSIPLSPRSSKTGLGKSGTFRDEQAVFHIHEKEIDLKIKAIEAKFHEEKLKLQQKHDGDVQKILDRKNSEIDEMKTMYRAKQNELEEIIRKLEKKVQTLLRESQVIRETKETQIAELKKLCEQSTDTLQNEWEKKLHNAVADMEQDKFELQKKHTENIQELLNDTNARLLKMESDYMMQTKTTSLTVKELEARVQQLTVEAESSNLQRHKLSQEKVEIEKSYEGLCNEVQELKTRCNSLQRERNHSAQDYEKQIQQLQNKYDFDFNIITQQNALAAAKASDVIEELEQRISQLKQQLQESEHQRQQQLRDQDCRFQKEKLHLERQNEKKVYNLQRQVDEETEKAQKKILKVEGLLKEKEEQLTRVTEIQRLKAQQADAALEEFKQQVEANTEKVYSEMKQQMEKVEADLIRSKSARERQAKEYTWQLEELKQSCEQKIVELKLEHEQEKTYLFQQHNTEKEEIIKHHEQEIDRLEMQLQNAMSDHEKKTQALRRRDAQMISDLEAQVYKLKEELVAVNTQRKQQLVELEHLREDERHKMVQEHEAVMNKLRSDMESMKISLQKTHATQKEAAIEKANSRFKQIEKEYIEKLSKSTLSITGLQKSVAAAREENNQQKQSMEERLQETLEKSEEEKRNIIKENEKTMKILKSEVDTYCNQLRVAEKKLQEKELVMQEQITCIRQDYERRIKGLMPTSMRQELEDTISSLKTQVNFLQKRANVLQEDLRMYKSKMGYD